MKRALPVLHGAWRLAEDRLTPLADAATRAALSGDAPKRVALVEERGERAFVKLFRHATLRRALRHTRYAPDEAANTLRACERGVPAPRVLGIAQWRNALGLVAAAALMLEELRGYGTVEERIAASPGDAPGVLAAAHPAFVALYRAGCCHIDLNPGNVLIADDAARRAVVIDFQYAHFAAAPHPRFLIYQAANFLYRYRATPLNPHPPIRLPDDTLTGWVRALMEETGIADAAWLDEWRRHTERPRPSRRWRLRLARTGGLHGPEIAR